MQDLISRQAAIDAIENCEPGEELFVIESLSAQPEMQAEAQEILQYLDERLHPLISPEHWSVYSELYDMVSMLSSAQPEIIRCKECKKAHKCYGDVIMRSRGGGNIYCPLTYCSEGERKDG